MEKRDFKVGIVGAGWIAAKAAETLGGLAGFRPFAIGSRSLEKARAFADEWGIERAYGSYSEVVDDPDVDLLYDSDYLAARVLQSYSLIYVAGNVGRRHIEH